MCDNMERFFYQAWKEQGLHLPPGAGPTLSSRPNKPKGPAPAWDDGQQANKAHKRKQADLFFGVSSCSQSHCVGISHMLQALQLC